MSWRKSIIFAVDCLAVLAAMAMAAPFVLILVSHFYRRLGRVVGVGAGGKFPCKAEPATTSPGRVLIALVIARSDVVRVPASGEPGGARTRKALDRCRASFAHCLRGC